MGAIEIITIIIAVLIVVGVLATYIVRKAKGKPTGDCAGCPYANGCKHGDCCHGESIDLSKYTGDSSDDSDRENQ